MDKVHGGLVLCSVCYVWHGFHSEFFDPERLCADKNQGSKTLDGTDELAVENPTNSSETCRILVGPSQGEQGAAQWTPVGWQ